MFDTFCHIGFCFQGHYEAKSFQLNQNLDLIMNFLPVNKVHSVVVTMRNKFSKVMEIVYTFSINFEVLELE